MKNVIKISLMAGPLLLALGAYATPQPEKILCHDKGFPGVCFPQYKDALSTTGKLVQIPEWFTSTEGKPCKISCTVHHLQKKYYLIAATLDGGQGYYHTWGNGKDNPVGPSTTTLPPHRIWNGFDAVELCSDNECTVRPKPNSLTCTMTCIQHTETAKIV